MSTSPVAWRHLLPGGHYTIEDGGKTIDLDARCTMGWIWSDGNFGGL